MMPPEFVDDENICCGDYPVRFPYMSADGTCTNLGAVKGDCVETSQLILQIPYAYAYDMPGSQILTLLAGKCTERDIDAYELEQDDDHAIVSIDIQKCELAPMVAFTKSFFFI